jgi:OmpA-OmpF porin, OOP family
MSFNLIDAAKGIFTNELVNKASSYLGESESSITKAISSILPSVIGGIADKSASTEGANIVANVAQESHGAGILDSISSFFGNEGGGLLNKGAGLLSSLFGDSKMGMLTNLISSFSGIKSTSATSLMSMAAPAVMGFLGKHAADNNLNAGGLASMLSSQKDNIAAAIPGGLNLGSVFNSFSGTAANVAGSVKSASGSAAGYAEDAVEQTGSAMKWLLPLLLLALIAAALLYFWKGCGKADAGASHNDATHKTAEHTTTGGTDVKTPAVDMPKVTVDSVSGLATYDLGKDIEYTLPDGTKFMAAENGFEGQLLNFIKTGTIDTVNKSANWYNMFDVQFKSGGNVYQGKAQAQIKNTAAILKAYPAVQIKLGGYTDNTGAADINKKISQTRADIVKADLIKQGAKAEQIKEAIGYGPEFPVADNGTAEGRARNRRVACKVSMK